MDVLQQLHFNMDSAANSSSFSEDNAEDNKRSFGNFRHLKKTRNIGSLKDFIVPANFYKLYILSDLKFIRKLQRMGLIATRGPMCYRCCTHMVLRKNKQAAMGYRFECSCRNPRKSKTVKNWSFFESMKINVRDALVYIRTYLLQEKNKVASKEAGISKQAGMNQPANQHNLCKPACETSLRQRRYSVTPTA